MAVNSFVKKIISCVLAFGLLISCGCGGSNNMSNLKRLAAARKAAGKSSGEEDSEAKPQKKKEKPAQLEKDRPAAEKKETNKSPGGQSGVPTQGNGFAPGGDAEFDDFQARMHRLYAEREKTLSTPFLKIQAVADAIDSYVSDNRGYPARAFPFPGNQLSWRVALLPYLGYGELFEKFDLKSRYNSKVNRRLLSLMPPEYRTLTVRHGPILLFRLPLFPHTGMKGEQRLTGLKTGSPKHLP